MRRFSTLVFTDFIVGTNDVYTAPIHDITLGSADRLAIQAVSDQVSGTTPVLQVYVQHSSDGRQWTDKNGGTPEINQSLNAALTNNATGYEGGSNPSHAQVRLRMRLTGTNPVAHVKVWVTGHDRVP